MLKANIQVCFHKKKIFLLKKKKPLKITNNQVLNYYIKRTIKIEFKNQKNYLKK